MKSTFNRQALPYIKKELSDAKIARMNGDQIAEFYCLEAHVIGQNSTYYHVKVHMLMLMWAIRQRAVKEMAGQVFRIIGAAVLTRFGLVPTGNTGGANVSLKPMQIAPEL